MKNIDKLILLKHRSKNFRSVVGRKIYIDTIDLLNEVRHNPALQEGQKVTDYLKKYDNILK